MRRRWIMGNWKMHGSSSSIRTLLGEIKNAASVDAGVVVFPPAIYLPLVQTILKDSSLELGAQNIYPASTGAYTGELSAPMLKEFGCQFVLIGHSERRHLLNESNDFIAQKFAYVKEQGMTPVLCVGETLEERQQELTKEIILEQLSHVAQACETGLLGGIIAYEPVWAIGTGHAAQPAQVAEVHGIIRDYLKEMDASMAEETSILYGGSVTPDNASELFALDNVDGGLVGGASLDASRFIGIIQCIN